MRNPIFFAAVTVSVFAAAVLIAMPVKAAGYLNCGKVANDVSVAYTAKHTLGVDLTTLPATFILRLAESLPAGLKDTQVRKGIKEACDKEQA